MQCINPYLVLYDTVTNTYLTRQSDRLPSLVNVRGLLCDTVGRLLSGSIDFNTTRYRVIPTPCGKCMPCKVNHMREWQLRMCHEYDTVGVPNAVFITLTYNNDNLPADGNLHYDDFKLFLRRLEYVLGKSIRYYVAGEYGPKTGRPHWHAILYGVSLDDLGEVELVKTSWSKSARKSSNLYVKSVLSDCWDAGYHLVSLAEPGTIQYVASYLIDKSYKPSWVTVLPFSRMSLRPGLGKDWFMRYNSDVLKGYLNYGGYKYAVPRYYRKLLFTIFPDAYNYFIDHVANKTGFTDHDVDLIISRYNAITEYLQSVFSRISNESVSPII